MVQEIVDGIVKIERQQDQETGVLHHRQSDKKACYHQGVLDVLQPHQVNHPEGYGVGGTALFKDLAEHGAKGEDQKYFSRGFANSFDDGVQVIDQVHVAQQTKGKGGDQERQEGMEFEFADHLIFENSEV